MKINGGYILFDSNYVMSGKGKTLKAVKRSVVAKVLEEGGMNRQNKGNFEGSEIIL